MQQQTLCIGDDCVTRRLDCARNSAGTSYECTEMHCGNDRIERGERCGEVGLAVCGSTKTCDTCVCVSP